MNKIYTLKVREDVSQIEEKISTFISEIEDKCDGVFTLTYRDREKIGAVSLCIVTGDTKFAKEINGKKLSSDMCPIRVLGIPVMSFFDRSDDIIADEMLKSGTVIFDKTGTLTRIKKNIDSNNNICPYRSRGIVKIKPPLQYVKK